MRTPIINKRSGLTIGEQGAEEELKRLDSKIQSDDIWLKKKKKEYKSAIALTVNTLTKNKKRRKYLIERLKEIRTNNKG